MRDMNCADPLEASLLASAILVHGPFGSPLFDAYTPCSTADQLLLVLVLKVNSPCDVAASSVLPFWTRRKTSAPFNSGPPTRLHVAPPSLEAITPTPA